MLCAKPFIPSLFFAITILSYIPFISNSQVYTSKAIEKNMVRVNDSLYASRFETTNAEYKNFLASINQTNPELYEKYIVDSSAWIKIFSYNEPYSVYVYHRHPAFAKYPVVNVSYEGALAYCSWLAEIYNNDPKRKFRKIAFSLPDTIEWKRAACGNRKNAMYPWGYFLRNKKGEYLCNMKHVDESLIVGDSLGNPVLAANHWSTAGGAFYTTQVDSFLPNDLGIYNMSGNVAEMTIEKGIAKGGGWNSFGGDVTIAGIRQFNGVWPDIGFRVFMKIIEP